MGVILLKTALQISRKKNLFGDQPVRTQNGLIFKISNLMLDSNFYEDYLQKYR